MFTIAFIVNLPFFSKYHSLATHNLVTLAAKHTFPFFFIQQSFGSTSNLTASLITASLRSFNILMHVTLTGATLKKVKYTIRKSINYNIIYNFATIINSTGKKME